MTQLVMTQLAASTTPNRFRCIPVSLGRSRPVEPRHPVSDDGRPDEDRGAADRRRSRRADDRLDRRSAFWYGIGVVLLAITALYAWPRTAVLGAVLLTGYLGGAVATHLRVGDPLFSHILFGVCLGIALWGGLWLSDGRVRALLPAG